MRFKLLWGICALFLHACVAKGAQRPSDFYLHPSAQLIPSSEINHFAGAIAAIKQYYIKPVKDETLFANAIDGMLKGLDPHSSYLDQRAVKALNEMTHGRFVGVGIRVLPQEDALKVIAPIDHSPAAKAGIQPGDLIVKVNQTLLQKLNPNKAIQLIRGKPGTSVTLTILRSKQDHPLVIKLKRAVVDLNVVEGHLLGHGFAYLRIGLFHQPTEKHVKHMIQTLRHNNHDQPITGLILDLRNNPGGLFESSVAVADLFLDARELDERFPQYHRKIVYTKGRVPVSHIIAEATRGDILHGAPIVALINSGSASASEIVAGAFQDYHRAILLGTSTFGKGSVQTVLPLNKISAIKLTTSLYYTPAGHQIQAKGIQPDVSIPQDSQMKRPEKQAVDSATESLKEVNLPRYLSNLSKTQPQSVSNKKIEQALLYQDFPVFTALSILKSLHAVQPKSIL